ncbi:unnamed protein product [Gongylonema pulchrum]|uniref:Large ribosomal subunit protein eL30 n=1 Tax=Gongylonema pulchrum TaxID=637853 RepID=A0A183E577_9BILA|nr:unnamed protein product [Gongylonema pulchrum]
MAVKKQVCSFHLLLLRGRPFRILSFKREPQRHKSPACCSATKKSTENINARLAMVMKSGKYCLGYKQALKTLRAGKAKLVIIANNTPPLRSRFVAFRANYRRY